VYRGAYGLLRTDAKITWTSLCHLLRACIRTAQIVTVVLVKLLSRCSIKLLKSSETSSLREKGCTVASVKAERDCSNAGHCPHRDGRVSLQGRPPDSWAAFCRCSGRSKVKATTFYIIVLCALYSASFLARHGSSLPHSNTTKRI
jgi:hypothetical protein